MTLRDLLKKKDRVAGSSQHEEKDIGGSSALSSTSELPPPQKITLMRSDTNTEELISPPTFSTTRPTPPATSSSNQDLSFENDTNSSNSRQSSSGHHALSSRFRSSSSASMASNKSDKRLSQLLHLQRSSRPRASSSASIHVPQDLPDISPVGCVDGGNDAKKAAEEREARWEERATILAMSNPETVPTGNHAPIPGAISAVPPTIGALAALEGNDPKGPTSLTNPETDDSLQRAINLHEKGDLTQSTGIFSRLAQPAGPNNPLAQVLYGLALRHGWGVPPDASQAVHYLSLAASSSASIESLALRSGLKRGGAAKGELTLAIFELGNCYRHGWGVKKDPIGARTYYEVAANLGDIDACREAAWCWLEGFGGGKDKRKAAGYLRRAQGLEKGEGKVGGGVGESWVWKEKYND